MTARRFQLSVATAEGSLERVLGVVRRRGLGLERLAVDRGDGLWRISIEAAASEQEIGLALKQFRSLIDVRAANVE